MKIYKLYFCRKGTVPIGRPMLATEIRLFDDQKRPITEDNSIGELHIGGISRRCLVDDENGWNGSYLRPTGDLAIRLFDDKGAWQYHLIGRRDDQTKRMGKRLNLSQISQVSREFSHLETLFFKFCSFQIIEKNVNVKRCVILLGGSGILRAFVQLHSNLPSAIECTILEDTIIKELRRTLSHTLPSHCQPDFYHRIDTIPMTKHGK